MKWTLFCLICLSTNAFGFNHSRFSCAGEIMGMGYTKSSGWREYVVPSFGGYPGGENGGHGDLSAFISEYEIRRKYKGGHLVPANAGYVKSAILDWATPVAYRSEHDRFQRCSYRVRIKFSNPSVRDTFKVGVECSRDCCNYCTYTIAK